MVLLNSEPCIDFIIINVYYYFLNFFVVKTIYRCLHLLSFRFKAGFAILFNNTYNFRGIVENVDKMKKNDVYVLSSYQSETRKLGL